MSRTQPDQKADYRSIAECPGFESVLVVVDDEDLGSDSFPKLPLLRRAAALGRRGARVELLHVCSDESLERARLAGADEMP